MKIKCFIKQPGRNPYSTAIEDNLHNLQVNVGGYIEIVHIGGLTCILNEEGKLNGMEPNFMSRELMDVLHGPVIFCGERVNKEGETVLDNIPVTFAEFKKRFPELWTGTVGVI